MLHDSAMSPDKKARASKTPKKRAQDLPIKTRPAADDVYDIVYFVRTDGSQPGRNFVNALPASPRAKMKVCLVAVAEAPPTKFAGGGYWEAMHGDMSGWFEVRIDAGQPGGAGTLHHRLFCRLDNEAQGRDRPLLVAITGMSKPYRTTFTDDDYAEVRALGDEYFSCNPRSIAD